MYIGNNETIHQPCHHDSPRPPSHPSLFGFRAGQAFGFRDAPKGVSQLAESPHGMKSAGDDPISTFKLKFIGVSHN